MPSTSTPEKRRAPLQPTNPFQVRHQTIPKNPLHVFPQQEENRIPLKPRYHKATADCTSTSATSPTGRVQSTLPSIELTRTRSAPAAIRKPYHNIHNIHNMSSTDSTPRQKFYSTLHTHYSATPDTTLASTPSSSFASNTPSQEGHQSYRSKRNGPTDQSWTSRFGESCDSLSSRWFPCLRSSAHPPTPIDWNFWLSGFLPTYAAKFILEVFGGTGAIWGFSEAVGLRTQQNSVTTWRPVALAVGFLFFLRWLYQVQRALRAHHRLRRQHSSPLPSPRRLHGLWVDENPTNHSLHLDESDSQEEDDHGPLTTTLNPRVPLGNSNDEMPLYSNPSTPPRAMPKRDYESGEVPTSPLFAAATESTALTSVLRPYDPSSTDGAPLLPSADLTKSPHRRTVTY